MSSPKLQDREGTTKDLGLVKLVKDPALFTIEDTFRGGLAVVSLAGVPLNCCDWNENSGGSIVAANANMDVAVPFLGTYDIAQALRLNDD